MDDGYEKAIKALVVLVLLASLTGICISIVGAVGSDSSIKGCYLESGLSFDGQRTAIMGRVEWGADIRIGYFTEYEQAEKAMARYKDCHVKP